MGRQPDPDPRGLLVISVDGTLWEPIDFIAEFGLRAVAYGNGVYVAIGEGSQAYVSEDGTVWRVLRLPNGVFLLYAITFVEGQFVAVGPERIVTSPDGLDWTSREQPSQRELNAVAGGADTVVAVGSDGAILQSGFLTRPLLSSPLLFNGVFEFSLSGKVGGIYRIQTTTDLTSGNWTDLGFLTNSAGSTRFSDPNAAQPVSRFYRAVLRP